MTRNQKFGRPKVANPRTEQINLSFSKSELVDIQRRAQALGMRPSQFGRMILLDGKSAPLVQPRLTFPVTGVIHHLSRLGNNLNQLVAYLHTTGAEIPDDLNPLLRDIRQLIVKLSQ